MRATGVAFATFILYQPVLAGIGPWGSRLGPEFALVRYRYAADNRGLETAPRGDFNGV